MSAEEMVVEQTVAHENKKPKQVVLQSQKFWKELEAEWCAYVEKLLNSDLNSADPNACLLMLYRRALSIEVTRLKPIGYSFFEFAMAEVAKLEGRFPALKKTHECLYFHKLIAVKEKLKEKDQPPLGEGRDLYITMSIFDDVVQKANFTPEDREKAYEWANVEMERALNPGNDNQSTVDTFCTEWSSKGEMRKVKTYHLGRTTAWASIGLGVALIVASAISVGGTLGVSFLPIFLPTLWLSCTLISAGLAAIAGGITAKNKIAPRYEKVREDKEERKGACIGVKAAFWHLPKEEEPGIGSVCLGGIFAIIGNSGLFR